MLINSIIYVRRKLPKVVDWGSREKETCVLLKSIKKAFKENTVVKKKAELYSSRELWKGKLPVKWIKYHDL